jgi:hypothetical protein
VWAVFVTNPNSTSTNSMIPHLLHHNPHPCHPTHQTRRLTIRPHRKRFPILLPLAGLALVLALASCEPSAPPKPPPVTVTDTQPVGEGLKVIGFAMLGAACVVVLGRLIR